MTKIKFQSKIVTTKGSNKPDVLLTGEVHIISLTEEKVLPASYEPMRKTFVQYASGKSILVGKGTVQFPIDGDVIVEKYKILLCFDQHHLCLKVESFFQCTVHMRPSGHKRDANMCHIQMPQRQYRTVGRDEQRNIFA